jgi:hypothetical protein
MGWRKRYYKKRDLNSNKAIFNQQHNYAKKIADIFNPEVRKRIMSSKKGKTVFPSPDIIYRTNPLMEPEKNNSKTKKNSVSKNENTDHKTYNSPIKDKDDKNNKDTNENLNKNKSYNEEESIENEEEEEDEEDYEYEDDKSTNIPEDKYSKKGNNNSTNNNASNNKNQQNNKRKQLFINRDKSRFDFCNNDNKENNIVVPKHILNLIDKKINSYNLTKYMHQKIIDKFFLNESIKDNNKGKNDEWIKFINENIDASNYNNYNNNDEFINDIDNINHFIFNKVTSQNCSNKNN